MHRQGLIHLPHRAFLRQGEVIGQESHQLHQIRLLQGAVPLHAVKAMVR